MFNCIFAALLFLILCFIQSGSFKSLWIQKKKQFKMLNYSIFICSYIHFWKKNNIVHKTIFLNTITTEKPNRKNLNWKKKRKKGEEEVGKGCLLNMFRCENGPCIDEQFRCNGVNDCPYDTSDELDCYANRKSLSFHSHFEMSTSLKKHKTIPHSYQEF